MRPLLVLGLVLTAVAEKEPPALLELRLRVQDSLALDTASGVRRTE